MGFDLSFEAYLPKQHPPWLRGKWGTLWTSAMGFIVDLQIRGILAATRAHFPGRAHDDDLQRHAADRNLEGYPAETTAEFRARIARAWETWTKAGTNEGVEAGLQDIGIEATCRDPGNGWYFEDAANWSRFVVIAEPSEEFDPPVIGPDLALPYCVGALNSTPQRVNLIRRIVRKWRAAHCLPEALIIPDEDAAMIGPDLLLPYTVGGDANYIQLTELAQE